MGKLTRKFLERPIVFFLAIAVLCMSSFVVGGAFVNSSFSDYVYNYNNLLIGGALIVVTPIFYSATRNTLRSDRIDRELIEANKGRYADFDNYISTPLVQSVYRLYLESADQRSYATKNLSIGMGITVVSFILLISLIITSRSSEISSMNTEQFLYTYFLPRVSGVVLIQLIGSLFLRWYTQNVRNIGHLSDRILYVEIILAGQSLAGDDEKSKRAIISDQLTKFELAKLNQDVGNTNRLDKILLKKLADNTTVKISSTDA